MHSVMWSCCFRYAPSKRWHIDTIMRVLTTVRISNICLITSSINRHFADRRRISPASFLHPCSSYRLGAMSETIPFPTSSSSSPTAWRCTPTQYRDYTKHCWMTSLRSAQLFCVTMISSFHPAKDPIWKTVDLEPSKLLQMWKEPNICDLSNMVRKGLYQVYLIFFVCPAATFSAGSVLVHRGVWRPTGVWAVWGGGTHPGKPTYLSPLLLLPHTMKNSTCRFFQISSSSSVVL